MNEDLKGVRARCAYWEKRIELEKAPRRRMELSRMAWVEITRLVIHRASMAHVRDIAELQALVKQQFLLSLREARR